MMTRKGVFVILVAMAASTQFAYEIRLEPDAAKRRTVSILKSQGPETAMLYLYAPAPWVIAGSAITAQDDNLWSGFNTTPNNYCHIYRMVSARSSQQYVTVFGQLTQPGDGYGINPWFKATVPAVDIDWVNHSGTGHEDDEDAWTGFCPLTKVQDQRTKVIVRKLKDDRSLVSASMTLECWPTTAVRFLKEDGVTALWSGATVSDLETPLTLYVDPQASGPFTVTLKGPSDDAFNRPTDYLSGKAVLLDLDVDADNNGAINDTDDPLEEDPGGILASGAVKQVCMKLEPSGLTGKLTLTAVSGGSLIRVWQDAGKSTPVALPAEWDLSGGYTFPTTVYVEGVAASSAARDVQLRLRYTEAEGQYTEDNIRLTVISVRYIVVDTSDGDSFYLNESEGIDNIATVKGVNTIILRAVISPDIPETRAVINWQGATEDTSVALKATLSRSTSTKKEVRVCVNDFSCRLANVWVVWSAFTSFNNTGPTPDDSSVSLPPDVYGATSGIKNGMLLQNTISPSGFFAIANVEYDIKRTKERGAWSKLGSVWQQYDHDGPGADDDNHDEDEDLTPSVDGHIYVLDAPGFTISSSFADEAVYKASFIEFVKIKLGFSGWIKCSDNYEWHSITWLEDNGSGKWKRKSSGPNEIAPGAITVGTSSTP
jgi:hypothetical protein